MANKSSCSKGIEIRGGIAVGLDMDLTGFRREKSAISLKRRKINMQLVQSAYTKLYIGFHLVPKLMTLNNRQ